MKPWQIVSRERCRPGMGRYICYGHYVVGQGSSDRIEGTATGLDEGSGGAAQAWHKEFLLDIATLCDLVTI